VKSVNFAHSAFTIQNGFPIGHAMRDQSKRMTILHALRGEFKIGNKKMLFCFLRCRIQNNRARGYTVTVDM